MTSPAPGKKTLWWVLGWSWTLFLATIVAECLRQPGRDHLVGHHALFALSAVLLTLTFVLSAASVAAGFAERPMGSTRWGTVSLVIFGFGMALSVAEWVMNARQPGPGTSCACGHLSHGFEPLFDCSRPLWIGWAISLGLGAGGCMWDEARGRARAGTSLALAALLVLVFTTPTFGPPPHGKLCRVHCFASQTSVASALDSHAVDHKSSTPPTLDDRFLQELIAGKYLTEQAYSGPLHRPCPVFHYRRDDRSRTGLTCPVHGARPW